MGLPFKTQGCNEKRYFITQEDLPLCCPLPGQRLWDAHPRVYLAVSSATRRAICPYCSTEYILHESEL